MPAAAVAAASVPVGAPIGRLASLCASAPTLLPLPLPYSALNRFKHGGRGWENPLKTTVANAGVRDELKNVDQVRKEHREEAKKREHLARVSRCCCWVLRCACGCA